MKKLYYLLFLTLIFGWSTCWAQTKVVKGMVVDANGDYLIGVSVYVKGTTNGTITNIDGRYVISNVSPTDTLVYSFIGFDIQEILVDGHTDIDVVLKTDMAELEEVQVVAFQKQKKESVIASINTIKPAELKQPSTNLTNSMAGRIAGVISYQRSGEPGADNAEFFIRGVTSFGYKNSPLILLDGFEITSSDLARIEPDNIASFSIMKDATATALYGARGANGVIMVTTKEGKKGKAKISVRLETVLATPTKMNEFLEGVDYMNLYNAAERSRNPDVSPEYSKEKIENTRDNINPYVYPNVNWYNELFNDYTRNTKANINVNGGGEVARYYLAVSYVNETGLLKVDNRNNFNNNIDIDRYNLRANIDIDLSKTTVASVKFYSLYDRYNGPTTSASDIFQSVVKANPVNFPKFFPEDEANAHVNHTMFGNKGNGGYENPYANMVKGYRDQFTSTILSQFKIEQDLSFITKGLSARGLASIKNYSKFETDRSFTPYYYNVAAYDAPSNSYLLNQISEGTEYLGAPLNKTWANSRSYFELATTYGRDFDRHSVGGLLVYTQEERLNTIEDYDGTEIYASLPARNMGLAGRFTYGYDSRYFIELNFGYNGSERFSEDQRFGFFPSAGLGWAVSNEAFWQRIKPVVNLLKLKGTYGFVGNDAIAEERERFLYLSSVNLDDNGKGYAWGENYGTYYPGATINRYPNPDVTWEVAEKMNIGFEMGLFDKVNIQADYFTENRTNIYMENQFIPATMGLSSTISNNIGEAKSHGIDGSIDYKQFFGNDLWITGRANFTYATSEMVVNGEPDYAYDYLSEIGQPLNQPRGLVAERLFIDENEIMNSPEQTFGGEVLPGDIKYVDVNKDGKIDANDMVPMGYPTVPEIVYGFGLSTGYKNFDFSFFFQGSARSSFFIRTQDGYEWGQEKLGITPFVDERNALKIVADNHWSDTNPDPYAFWPRLSVQPEPNNVQPSSWWLRDGSFLRLKSVELGYTLPTSLLNKVRVKEARVYVSGNNLLTFSKFKLWDPEMGGNGLGYPTQMLINMGVNIHF
ncbi:TonB-dependent receptor [Labilibacter sediminis]|nr:TonB-dependent receptor [Labilibacter sediminis]